MVNHMAHPGTVLGLERVAHLAQTLVALHKLIEDLELEIERLQGFDELTHTSNRSLSDLSNGTRNQNQNQSQSQHNNHKGVINGDQNESYKDTSDALRRDEVKTYNDDNVSADKPSPLTKSYTSLSDNSGFTSSPEDHKHSQSQLQHHRDAINMDQHHHISNTGDINNNKRDMVSITEPSSSKQSSSQNIIVDHGEREQSQMSTSSHSSTVVKLNENREIASQGEICIFVTPFFM